LALADVKSKSVEDMDVPYGCYWKAGNLVIARLFFNPTGDKKSNNDGADRVSICVRAPPDGDLPLGVILGVLFGLLAVGLLVYFAYMYRRKYDKNQDLTLRESLLDNDGLEMSVGQPISHVGSVIRPNGDSDVLQRSQLTAESDLSMARLNPIGSPEFDPEEGFPINDSARALCVRQWTVRSDVNKSLNEEQFPSTADGAAQHTTNVQYTDLQAATNNFGPNHKIGDGGSCVVYKAELYGLPCAIKLLSQDASEWEKKQFAAEISVLTHIKHANICQLYACSTDGPSRCLVLELMDTSLEDRLCMDPPLGWEQRAYILVCVVRGLAHLHSQSPPMIHRDVKSQNGTSGTRHYFCLLSSVSSSCFA
jgi:hypothetical protein